MERMAQGGITVIWTTFMVLFLSFVQADENVVVEHALTLDYSNFSETVSKHNFILVQFYSPGCKHCKNLAPEYEKAAAALSVHDPPIVLAKVNVRDEANDALKIAYEITSFPTLRIFRNGGETIQEYKGTRQADGIVAYLKRQAAPASVEIKSVEDAVELIDNKKIFVAGIFPELAGEEYKNFILVSERLRGDYDFGHTLDAAFLPHADVVNQPTVRLIKPFDELFVDFQDFDVDALEDFIIEASIPMVTINNDDPNNFDFVNKFLQIPKTKVLLFVNFSLEHDSFRSTYNDLAVLYKANGMNFLLGDIEPSEEVLQYYQLKNDQTPLIIVQNVDGPKYLKTNIVPDDIAPWLKDYMDGKLKQYIRSEPIPKSNDRPVKIVVLDNLQDMVFDSGKNVLLEFYVPKCAACVNIARTIYDVAKSFENDHDVMIAKMDASVNDVSPDIFDIQEFPTLYFKSANGNLSEYNGDAKKESIIDFIQNNRAEPAKTDSIEEGQAVKDEL